MKKYDVVCFCGQRQNDGSFSQREPVVATPERNKLTYKMSLSECMYCWHLDLSEAEAAQVTKALIAHDTAITILRKAMGAYINEPTEYTEQQVRSAWVSVGSYLKFLRDTSRQ